MPDDFPIHESMQEHDSPDAAGVSDITSEIVRSIISADNDALDAGRDLEEPTERGDFKSRVEHLAQIAFWAGKRSGLSESLEIVKKTAKRGNTED